MNASRLNDSNETASRRSKKEAVSIFIIQSTGAGLLLLMHFVCTRTLSPEHYGVFNYALTIANTLSLVACLGFQTSLIRFVSEYFTAQQGGLLKGLLIYSLLIITGTAVGLSLIMVLLSTILPIGNENLKASLLYSALLLPIISVGVWRGMFTRGLQKIAKAILPEEIVRPIIVITLLTVLWLTGTMISSYYATVIYATSGLAALGLGFFFLYRAIPKNLISTPIIQKKRQWLSTSLTMLAGGISQEIVNRADILLIGALVGVEQSGPYNIALRLSLLNVFTLKIVDTLVAPKIAAAHFQQKPEELKKIVLWGMKISALGALPACCVLLAFPEWALGLFGPAYTEASTTLRILVIGQFINGLKGPVGYALLMTGKEKLFTNTIAAIMLTNIIAQIIFITLYGSTGAAIVTSSTTTIFSLLLLSYFIRNLPRKPL